MIEVYVRQKRKWYTWTRFKAFYSALVVERGIWRKKLHLITIIFKTNFCPLYLYNHPRVCPFGFFFSYVNTFHWTRNIIKAENFPKNRPLTLIEGTYFNEEMSYWEWRWNVRSISSPIVTYTIFIMPFVLLLWQELDFISFLLIFVITILLFFSFEYLSPHEKPNLMKTNSVNSSPENLVAYLQSLSIYLGAAAINRF